MSHATKIINYESDEAASIKTVTGWVDSTGHFWGSDEHMARYAGSTHRACEADPTHGIHAKNAWCPTCREQRLAKDFEAMPRKEYDGSPVCVYDSDQYFFDAQEIVDWLIDHDMSPADVRLVFCEPNMAEEIDPNDHFLDDLPEDGEVSDRLYEAFAALNEIIKTEPPLSWRPGKVVAVLPADFLS